MYKVIRDFTDLKDGNRQYKSGDKYPRTGLIVRKCRINELLGITGGVKYIEIGDEDDGQHSEKRKNTHRARLD